MNVLMRLLFLLFTPIFCFADSGAEPLLDWRGYFVIALLFVVMFLLVKEVFPPDLVLLTGGAIPVIIGIVPAKNLLFSFANETIVTIAMLFILVRAFKNSGLILFFAQKVLPNTKSRIKQMAVSLPPLSFLSAFLNNTPLVMILTPVYRKWALSLNECPSKFLIPLSYAAILGGACTLIGTSSNLIVNGLLFNANPAAAFSFFEVAKIGLPILILGLLYLIFFSYRLLPDCKDPRAALVDDVRKMTVEIKLLNEFSHIGKTVEEFGNDYLQGDFTLVEIKRDNHKLTAPGLKEILRENDRLVIVGDLNALYRLQETKGIEFEPESKFQIDPAAAYYSEYVVPSDSTYVGKKLSSPTFRKTLTGPVFAAYRHGMRLEGKLSEIIVKPGDILMVFSNAPLSSNHPEDSRDLIFLKTSDELSILKPKRALFTFLVLVAMVTAVTLGVSMMIASMAAALVLILTKMVSGAGVVRGINWSLILLIAGGLTLSSSLQATNVAHVLGQGLFDIIGSNPHLMVAGIFLLTTVLTEFITNTAAVLIVFPIAMEALGLSGIGSVMAMRAVGVTITMAGACSFITPIGYQTNTIVYGPGGYRFFDYMKIGIPLNLIAWLLCTVLIPIFWPF